MQGSPIWALVVLVCFFRGFELKPRLRGGGGSVLFVGASPLGRHCDWKESEAAASMAAVAQFWASEWSKRMGGLIQDLNRVTVLIVCNEREGYNLKS
jgi:hypothetical protein